MLTRSRLHGGEVLIVFVGAGTGQVAAVPRDQEFFLGPNIGMIRPNEQVKPEYLELYLRSPVGKRLLLASMKAVAQPSLSMTTIRQTPIALPSIEEQEEIVSRTQETMLAARELQTELGTGGTQPLRQSILAAAFRGELVQ
jgi:type I restriction enzyme S subunit